MSWRLIPIDKRSPALHQAEFGCLKRAYAINVTRGCSFYCVYCYARGYAIAPSKGTVYLYQNLPLLLQKEARRLPMGTPIIFNTASECFQNHPHILEITYRSMAILLRRGHHINFLTKGVVPKWFKDLFCRYRHHIQATIDVVSLKEDYCNLFEPGAPIGEKRLEGAIHLLNWGIPVKARLDPLIPFFSDTQENIENLLLAIKDCGIRKIIISYLELRPRIIEQLRQELPASIAKLILGCFPKPSWDRVGTKTLCKQVPLSIRKKVYQRIRQQGEKLGIKVIVCRCKNPDVSFSQYCLSKSGLPKYKRLSQPVLL